MNYCYQRSPHEALFRELALESKLENFCDRCEYREEFRDYEDWGSEVVYRCSDFSCKADLCPDSTDCPMHDEYEELREQYEETQRCDDEEEEAKEGLI